jgi:glycosyltransferase involved in cell wall biosynthesis
VTRLPVDVTVVVVNYNQARFLYGAVQSVIEQTKPVEEIIVIDDCSSDDSDTVLASLPPRVRVIRRVRNDGVIAARNEAFAEVNTRFVIFLDADDVLLPRFVERTLAAWSHSKDQSLAIVYSPVRRLYESPVGRFRRRHGYLLSRSFDVKKLARKNFICNTSLLLAEAVRSVACYSPEMDRLGHEDWDMFLSMAENGWRGHLVPRPLFCYRIFPNSRNQSSRERWTEVRVAIAARHPMASDIANDCGTFRRCRHAVVNASQWIFCVLDLLRWTWSDRRSGLRGLGVDDA